MGNLGEQISAELRDISRYGFEARWSRYWPLVFDVVETDPETVSNVRDAIVEMEERIAAGENRPTLDRLLGDQRGVWQEEAESVFFEFIQPFIHADGTSEEREALYNELQQVKQDVKTKIESTERAKAFPEYVLALDYVVAFGTIASMAFSKSDQRPVRTSPAASPAAAPVAAPAAAAPNVTQNPPAAPTPGTATPAPAAPQLSANSPAAPAAPLPTVPPINEPRAAAPKEPRKRRVGLFVTLFVLILLLAAGGATLVLRPELLNVEKLMAMLPGDGSFDTAIDEFVARTASSCPIADEELSLASVTGLEPCITTAKAEATGAFQMLVSDAGGTWSLNNGVEDWDAPAGEQKDKLMLAWEHLRELREAYDDQITQNVIRFDDQFYPPDEERDAQGWRFAVWLCTCNANAELVEIGDPERAHRVFISGPELVTTPHTYNNLVALLRDFFLSGEQLGDPAQVALTVEQFDLPHGLTAGPRLGGPFSTRRATEDAVNELKDFYRALQFSIIDVDLR